MSGFSGEHYPDDEISDDPGYSPATPLAVNMPESFIEREYEGFLDGYFHLTPDEANSLLLAIHEAQAKRDQWLRDNPTGIADLQAKFDAEENDQ